MDLQNQSTANQTPTSQITGSGKKWPVYLLWVLGAVVVLGMIFGFWLYFKKPTGTKPILPANFPADIAIYPNSKLLAGTGVITSVSSEDLSVTYSSGDSVEQVVVYLVANSTAWSLKERSAVTQPEPAGAQLDPPLSNVGDNRMLDGQQGNKHLMITVSNSENKTLIHYAVTLKK
jgi:hypothetical protein